MLAKFASEDATAIVTRLYRESKNDQNKGHEGHHLVDELNNDP